MKYRAYRVELNNGMETFRLMPLSKDCVFTEGLFMVEVNKLVLISEKTSEKFNLIEKFNPDGTMKMLKSGSPEVERLKVQMEVTYELGGNDLEWFINNYIQNSDFALEIVNKHKLQIEESKLIV